jgi:hypothetical protein
LFIISVQVRQLEPKRVKYVMKTFIERIDTSIDVIVCATLHTSKGSLMEETLL